MELVLFTHPSFVQSQSMPRFARMISEGMKERGHAVEIWTAEAFFHNLPAPRSLKKWLGYLDQFLVFPLLVRLRLTRVSERALFVFVDQALGPWIPLVAGRLHVVHCHDFLAQRSALGLIPENPSGRSGKLYQSFIRRGYQKARNFISVSKQTKHDLATFLKQPPVISEVVYNGLNPAFVKLDQKAARKEIGGLIKLDLEGGYLLHVGANQWYKNRKGVVEIYNCWRKSHVGGLPLLLVGPPASAALIAAREASPYREDIHLISGLDDASVRAVYAGASLFIFPSLAEGFGWPIAEAMASGCPVITTDEAPMTEVAGDSAFLISRRPVDTSKVEAWAGECADVVQRLLDLSEHERNEMISKGVVNARRFNAAVALDHIEAVYQKVLADKSFS